MLYEMTILPLWPHHPSPSSAPHRTGLACDRESVCQHQKQHEQEVGCGRLAMYATALATSLARVMRGRSRLEAKVDAARLAEFVLANAADEAKVDESSELVAKLVRLISLVDEKDTLDGKATSLSCLAAICRT